MPVGGGPTGGWCVVCGDCGCGAGGHGRPTGGWREACWGMWLRCRWAAARLEGVRGLQGLTGLRGDTPSEARGVDGGRAGFAPHGGLAVVCRAKLVGMEAAVPVGGGRARAGLEIDHSEPKARVWRSRGRAAAHRRIEQPQKARRVLASHGCLAGCAARRSDGCAITLPRLAIARARTPVLSPAACTTLEGSS